MLGHDQPRDSHFHGVATILLPIPCEMFAVRVCQSHFGYGGEVLDV